MKTHHEAAKSPKKKAVLEQPPVDREVEDPRAETLALEGMNVREDDETLYDEHAVSAKPVMGREDVEREQNIDETDEEAIRSSEGDVDSARTLTRP